MAFALTLLLHRLRNVSVILVGTPGIFRPMSQAVPAGFWLGQPVAKRVAHQLRGALSRGRGR
jgi:hypothetical protein